VQLQQSPFLSLISDQQIQQTLALMGQTKDARLTAEIAQQVCERTASAAVLDGSIASLGSQYVLACAPENCNTGSILAQEQVQAARREDLALQQGGRGAAATYQSAAAVWEGLYGNASAKSEYAKLP
jgi:hypothetical protein